MHFQLEFRTPTFAALQFTHSHMVRRARREQHALTYTHTHTSVRLHEYTCTKIHKCTMFIIIIIQMKKKNSYGQNGQVIFVCAFLSIGTAHHDMYTKQKIHFQLRLLLLCACVCAYWPHIVFVSEKQY